MGLVRAQLSRERRLEEVDPNAVDNHLLRIVATAERDDVQLHAGSAQGRQRAMDEGVLSAVNVACIGTEAKRDDDGAARESALRWGYLAFEQMGGEDQVRRCHQ